MWDTYENAGIGSYLAETILYPYGIEEDPVAVHIALVGADAGALEVLKRVGESMGFRE